MGWERGASGGVGSIGAWTGWENLKWWGTWLDGRGKRGGEGVEGTNEAVVVSVTMAAGEAKSVESRRNGARGKKEN